MPPEDFRGWQAALSLSTAQVCAALGIHPNTASAYRTRGGDRLLRLACLALWHRLDPDRPLPWSAEA